MNRQDAIDWVEDQFECSAGAPWRWADVGMSKPYQVVSIENDVKALHNAEDIEHRIVARFIVQMSDLKSKAGFRPHQLPKPKLFWRWKDLIRIEDGVLHARFYIDGNPGRPGGNPSKPWGRPTVGQMKEVA